MSGFNNVSVQSKIAALRQRVVGEGKPYADEAAFNSMLSLLSKKTGIAPISIPVYPHERLAPTKEQSKLLASALLLSTAEASDFISACESHRSAFEREHRIEMPAHDANVSKINIQDIKRLVEQELTSTQEKRVIWNRFIKYCPPHRKRKPYPIFMNEVNAIESEIIENRYDGNIADYQKDFLRTAMLFSLDPATLMYHRQAFSMLPKEAYAFAVFLQVETEKLHRFCNILCDKFDSRYIELPKPANRATSPAELNACFDALKTEWKASLEFAPDPTPEQQEAFTRTCLAGRGTSGALPGKR